MKNRPAGHLAGWMEESLMPSLQGHFLVASPHLPDANFYRTVVLMVQHDPNGAVGLILNRTTNSTVAELWQRVAKERALAAAGKPRRTRARAADGLAYGDVTCADIEVIPGEYPALPRGVSGKAGGTGGSALCACLSAMPAGRAGNWRVNWRLAAG